MCIQSETTTISKYFTLHPQLSVPMCGLQLCTLNSITQQREGRVLCQHPLSGPLCLFVCSFHLYLSIQPSPTSHSLIGDSMRECLDSLQLMSCLWINNIVMSLLSPRQGVSRQKAEMCLHHDTECVCVCVCADEAKEKQSYEKLLAHSVHHVYVCGSHYPHTKFTLVSWELVRGCSCAVLLNEKAAPYVLYSVYKHTGQLQK